MNLRRVGYYISDVINDRQTLKWGGQRDCVLLNYLNAELIPICHLLALLGAHHILHVSSVRVKHRRQTREKDV